MGKLVLIVGPQIESQKLRQRLYRDGMGLPVVNLLSDCWTLDAAVRAVEGARFVVVLEGETTIVGPARKAWDILGQRFAGKELKIGGVNDNRGISMIMALAATESQHRRRPVHGIKNLPATGRIYLGRYQS